MQNAEKSNDMKNKRLLLLCLLLSSFFYGGVSGYAQGTILVNLAQLDGIDLTPDNLFNFQIQSGYNRSTKAMITGTIKYRMHPEWSVSYEFTYTLQPGMNMISRDFVSPHFHYASSSLRELFEQYKKLPEGIYEYCVQVQPDYQSHELSTATFSQCIYHREASIFLINLINPEDKAKVYNYYPVLSWMVNYPIPSALSYRIKLTKIKQGQNTEIAVKRNPAEYDEKGLSSFSKMYPIYATPLVANQPYAWTVYAYYKDILLGEAQPWQFTIVEDSLIKGVPRDPSYVDIRRESGRYQLFAPGVLKLKYILDERKQDSLTLTLLTKNEKEVKLKENVLHAVNGDNRYILNFKDNHPLKHLQRYTLLIQAQSGAVYRITFQYINPDYIAR